MQITIPEGLTLEQAYKDLEALFPCRNLLDFNEVTSDRNPDETYIIEVKDNEEADEEFKNLSANQLKEKGILGITLLERLVLEKEYFLKTKKHLDTRTITLCSGSRRSDGNVLRVDWHGGKLDVYWCNPGSSSDGLRAREVVLINTDAYIEYLDKSKLYTEEEVLETIHRVQENTINAVLTGKEIFLDPRKYLPKR